MSSRKIEKLNEKYTANQKSIKLTGALWFYLSLHYFYELPSDLFNPGKQQELLGGVVSAESVRQEEENSMKLIYKVLCEVLKTLGDTGKQYEQSFQERFRRVAKKKLARAGKEVGEKRTSLAQRQEVVEGKSDPAEEGEFAEDDVEESKDEKEA